MAEAKTGAKKAPKAGLLKTASKGVATAAAKLAKAAAAKLTAPAKKEVAKEAKVKAPAKAEPAKPKVEKAEVEKAEVAKAEPAKPKVEKPKVEKPKVEKPKVEKPEVEKPEVAKAEPAKAKAGKAEVAKAEPAKGKVAKAEPAKGKAEKAKPAKGAKPSPAEPAAPASVPLSPFDVKPDKPFPRATKLPPLGNALSKREIEQLLTAGQGRGVSGEGSLKGKLVVKDGFPYLLVLGRDKRELTFYLRGPDQEVLPAYLDHKVSVTGLVFKTTNYGGIVDVRKYSAKKPETEVAAEPEPQEQKLRYLSPGEVEQVMNAGMGAGIHGFAPNIRGNLEMSGDEFFLVASNGGTRQQVSFTLTGKGAKGLRKFLGSTIVVTGVVDKSSGWGGNIEVEAVEARPPEFKAVAREGLELAQIEGSGEGGVVDAKLNGGLSVRLTERAGYTWAIEPTVTKRMSLREANYEPNPNGPATREFFFTPRNPGTFEVEFFLAKLFAPAQVARTYKLTVNVRP